jgi:hypothetical protein
MALHEFAGLYRAASYGYGLGEVPTAPPPLTVVAAPGLSGAQTITVFGGPTPLSDGSYPNVVNVNAPIIVGTAGNAETVTPTAVSTVIQSSTFGITSTITATFSNAHYPGDRVQSGTAGLQEALNAASGAGGGTVVVDQAWVKLGGTQAMLLAATVPLGVVIWDNRTGAGDVQQDTVVVTNAQILLLFTTAVQLLPAPGAGSFYNIIKATLVNENTGVAYTSGGALTVGYGPTSGLVQALSGTIAATFLTSPVVSQVIQLAGVNLASSTESTYDNQPIFINAATANFATGTGTLRVSLVYTIESK